MNIYGFNNEYILHNIFQNTFPTYSKTGTEMFTVVLLVLRLRCVCVSIKDLQIIQITFLSSAYLK